MATYTIPAMPLKANVWHRVPGPPPWDILDAHEVDCSCSPIAPAQFAVGFQPSEVDRAWTHIIRTMKDPNYVDNYMRGDERDLWPATAFEIPAGSGKYYIVRWAHVVGAGFPNEHARLFAHRWTDGLLANLPWFEGYI
jgi:hypothetical protein